MVALAWQQEKDDRCPGCGHPSSEAWSPDAEDEYAGRVLQCHACAARDAKRAQMNNPPPGSFVLARRVGQ